ncbi:hypothetical protein FWK35_00034261 [Aphis craccivora]|uniref:Uncharacterized protein n=1 Tax=Aphis craccivora TaxID=307492 RepID=A0A6G0Y7K7_APHCR|nr:hypothetical protein FWK35_00034261 [Aphis craccivora]
MNGSRLTVLFSITTLILLLNSVASRLTPIKKPWKLLDNTILECKVFNGAISKCHVKYEPVNKSTDNTLRVNSFKPTPTKTSTTTTTTTTTPRPIHTTRHGRQRRPNPKKYPGKPHYTTLPKIINPVVYCKCSNVLCKVDRFIGSNLNECNKNNKGLLQNLPNTLKKAAGKVIDGAARLGKKLVKTVVNSVASATKGVIRGGYKLGKKFYSGLKSGYKAVKRLGSKIANIGKSVFNWLF